MTDLSWAPRGGGVLALTSKEAGLLCQLRQQKNRAGRKGALEEEEEEGLDLEPSKDTDVSSS